MKTVFIWIISIPCVLILSVFVFIWTMGSILNDIIDVIKYKYKEWRIEKRVNEYKKNWED